MPCKTFDPKMMCVCVLCSDGCCFACSTASAMCRSRSCVSLVLSFWLFAHGSLQAAPTQGGPCPDGCSAPKAGGHCTTARIHCTAAHMHATLCTASHPACAFPADAHSRCSCMRAACAGSPPAAGAAGLPANAPQPDSSSCGPVHNDSAPTSSQAQPSDKASRVVAQLVHGACTRARACASSAHMLLVRV